MNELLGELLYSAIFWGSLVTLLLCWLLRKISNRFGRAVLWLPLVWFVVHTVIAWYGFLLPPSGRLIDADSGAPIKNSRVIATWSSYPLSLWTSYCTGKQAHLTRSDGAFAFRFAPYPTLLLGSFYRGLNPEVPGRIDNQRGALMLAPLRGDVLIQRYAPGRETFGGVGGDCDIQIAPQYSDNLQPLSGEESPFEVMYREACIEHQPWTLTDHFIRDMMMRRPKVSGGYSGWPPKDAPPEEIQHLLLEELDPRGCPPIGNECASSISSETHEKFCTYFATQRNGQGDMP